MDPEGSERKPDIAPRGAAGPLRVVAMAVQKGGTGKTTLAASLAIAA
ncbi:MAG: ParA family protein, partial [Actinomycetospora chiangmaiensis]|nr:ParA family protein [Actinomycetospora chiangmaiensis]